MYIQHPSVNEANLILPPPFPSIFVGEEGSGGFLYELQVQTLTLKTHMKRGTELRCL